MNGRRKVLSDEELLFRFELINENYTIGRIKESYSKRYFEDKKLIGRFSVDYLKEFLKKLPKNDALYVGVYVDKRGLAPLHCKRWLLGPRIYNKKIDYDECGER
jgi:hypothetical protein